MNSKCCVQLCGFTSVRWFVICHESVMPVPMTCHSPKTIICHSPKMKKVHFYIFTFLQRNTYLNGILNKEGNMKCYIIIIIYYIIIYYNIIYNNFINGFLDTLVRRKNPFFCKNVKM